MVNIVKNLKNEKIKVEDIEKGIAISKEYYCINCEKKMVFVKESIDGKKAHFKHYCDNGNESECEYYNKYNQTDIENEYINEKSEFHKRWQDIFDVENLEKKIEEEGKKHIADIYIKKDEGVKFNDLNNEIIYKNFIPKELIIEIQHSKISNESLIERTKFYHNKEKKREIIWIFDLKEECEIIEIITTINSIYRIKLKNQNNHVFQHLLKIDEFRPIIFLDNNDENIYLIKNKTILDRDYIDVLKISKNDFLGELSKNINKELRWVFDNKNKNYKKINYLETINKEIFDKNNRDYLNYIFYLMENIPYYEIKNKLEDLYHYIRLYSFNNNKIRQLFIDYVKSNRTIYRNIISFGKNKGNSINEVEYNYLQWIFENYELENIIDDNGNIEENGSLRNMENYKRNQILKNKDLFENIYTTVKEHEDSYRNLDFREYFDVEDEKIDYKKIQNENCIYKFMEDYLIDYNYLNKDTIQFNNDDKITEKHLKVYKKFDLIQKECFELKYDLGKFYCKFCNEKYYPSKAIELFNKKYSICYICFDSNNYEQLTENLNKKETKNKITTNVYLFS